MSLKKNIEIMPAREEHVEDCVRISLAVYEHIHDVYREHLGTDIHDTVMKEWRKNKADSIREQQSGEHAFVALLDGKVVGFAAFSIQGELGIIGNNAVDPEYRGNGIAGLLYQRLLKGIRENGARYAMVRTGGDEGHAPARKAYEKLGFKKFLPSVEYYMDLEDIEKGEHING